MKSFVLLVSSTLLGIAIASSGAAQTTSAALATNDITVIVHNNSAINPLAGQPDSGVTPECFQSKDCHYTIKDGVTIGLFGHTWNNSAVLSNQQGRLSVYANPVGDKSCNPGAPTPQSDGSFVVNITGKCD